jgi:hypothetical protein
LIEREPAKGVRREITWQSGLLSRRYLQEIFVWMLL